MGIIPFNPNNQIIRSTSRSNIFEAISFSFPQPTVNGMFYNIKWHGILIVFQDSCRPVNTSIVYHDYTISYPLTVKQLGDFREEFRKRFLLVICW